MFRLLTLAIKKENIKLSIKLTIPKEVMVGGVVKIKTGQLVLLTKVRKDGGSGCIVWVYIGITP